MELSPAEVFISLACLSGEGQILSQVEAGTCGQMSPIPHFSNQESGGVEASPSSILQNHHPNFCSVKREAELKMT